VYQTRKPGGQLALYCNTYSAIICILPTFLDPELRLIAHLYGEIRADFSSIQEGGHQLLPRLVVEVVPGLKTRHVYRKAVRRSVTVFDTDE
jgi:hypothetical protein